MAKPTFTVASEDAGNDNPAGAEAAKESAPTGALGKPADQPKADDAGKPATEEQAKADKEIADKKAADEQAAETAAKALLFDDIKDLKLPEKTIVDEAMAKEFSEWAKAGKLSKEQAQQAADMHLKTIGVFAQKLQQEAQATVKAWGDEITNDKELGGAKQKETLDTAEKYFALAEKVPGVNINRLKADMVRTGMANHPDLIRVSHFIGQHLGEDNMFISDKSTGGGPTDMAESWYGPTGTRVPR